MRLQEIISTPEYQSVVADYRDTCLWFANGAERPENEVQLEQTLCAIENHGDLRAFQRVGRIRKWLSPDFRPKYSNSSPVRG